MDSEARKERGMGGGLGGYSGRFSVLATDDNADGGWETRSKDNKRRKRSSGGTFETSEQNNRDNLNLNLPSKSQFRELSTDEKLVTLFEIMMSHIPSASARLNRTEDKLVSLEGTVTRDQSRI